MKRYLSILACIVLVIAMVCSLASCEALKNMFDKPDDEHTHNFVDGKCDCGESDPDYVAHEHNFVDGKCECGESDPDYVAHEHNFVDGKCECGESDPDYVAPHEHNFVDGKCECGESDPDYVAPTTGTQENPHALTVPGTLDVAFAGGYEPVWYSFTASETKTLGITLSSENADMGYGTSVDAMQYTGGKTYVEVNIEEGVTYLVNFSTVNAEAGEYTVTAAYVDKVSPYEVVINEGNYNTVTFSAEEIEAGEATRKLVITTASTYMFKGDVFVSKVVAAGGTEVTKNADYSYTLAAGEYTLTFGMFNIYGTAADTGVHLNVENQEEEDVGGDDPVVPAGPLDTENSELVIGPNTITVTDADIEEGAVTYTIVVTAAGTFTASSNDLGARFINANNEMVGFGIAELTPGTYTVVVVCAAVETAGDYTLTLEYTAPTSGGDDVTGGTEDDPIEVTLPAENIATEGDAINYLWYTFTSTDEGILTVTYSNANSWATFYMEGDEYNNQSGYQKQVITFEVQANSTYLLGLGVYDKEEGVTASLSFNAQALPKEGDFEKPFIAYAGDEFSCAYPGGNDATKFVWYKYDPWITGTLTITMGGRAIVKYGSDVENLATATNQQTITLDITAYTPVYIAIQSSSLAEETITFSLEALEAPGSYDNAHDAVIGDNTGAVPSGAYDVFFDYYAEKAGTLTFTYSDVSVYVYFDWEWLLVENNGTLSVSEAETYKIKVADFAEDATTVSFSLAFEEASVEIEGELKETLTLVAPTISSMFANSEVQTFEAAAGTYQIDAEGVADLVNTNVQLYDAVDDSWIKLNSSLPYTIEVTEATTLQFRLSCWSTSDEGKNVVIKIYGTESEGGEEGGGEATASGSFTVAIPNAGYNMYTFVAEATGTYTFTAASNIDILEADGDFPGYDAITSLDLEEGQEYVICVATMDMSVTEATVEWTYTAPKAPIEDSLAGSYEEAIGAYSIMFFYKEEDSTYYMNVWNGLWDLYYTYTAVVNEDGTVTIDPTFAPDYFANSGTVDVDGIADKTFVATPAGDSWTFSIKDETVVEGVINNPYIITESGEYTADVPAEDYVYYAYTNSGESDVTVALSALGENYWIECGTYSFMLCDTTLSPDFISSKEITVSAGATLFIKVSTNNSEADQISFSATIEEASAVVPTETALVIGNNAINAADIVFTYTADAAGTLSLTAGAAIMGPVSISYTVNGGDAQTLELSSTAELTLAANDEVVITVTASGYSSITAAWTAA